MALSPGERTSAAARLLEEPAFMDALHTVREFLGDYVLMADTPEERELRWQEFNAVTRIEPVLAGWAAEVWPDDNESL